MRVNIQLSKEAEMDVLESFRWYESAKKGLGENFLNELDEALISISENPFAFSLRYKKIVRAFTMDRFPFLVYYSVNKEQVDVIAVFHTSKNPKVWKKRI